MSIVNVLKIILKYLFGTIILLGVILVVVWMASKPKLPNNIHIVGYNAPSGPVQKPGYPSFVFYKVEPEEIQSNIVGYHSEPLPEDNNWLYIKIDPSNDDAHTVDDIPHAGVVVVVPLKRIPPFSPFIVHRNTASLGELFKVSGSSKGEVIIQVLREDKFVNYAYFAEPPTAELWHRWGVKADFEHVTQTGWYNISKGCYANDDVLIQGEVVDVIFLGDRNHNRLSLIGEPNIKTTLLTKLDPHPMTMLSALRLDEDLLREHGFLPKDDMRKGIRYFFRTTLFTLVGYDGKQTRVKFKLSGLEKSVHLFDVATGKPVDFPLNNSHHIIAQPDQSIRNWRMVWESLKEAGPMVLENYSKEITETTGGIELANIFTFFGSNIVEQWASFLLWAVFALFSLRWFIRKVRKLLNKKSKHAIQKAPTAQAQASTAPTVSVPAAVQSPPQSNVPAPRPPQTLPKKGEDGHHRRGKRKC